MSVSLWRAGAMTRAVCGVAARAAPDCRPATGTGRGVEPAPAPRHLSAVAAPSCAHATLLHHRLRGWCHDSPAPCAAMPRRWASSATPGNLTALQLSDRTVVQITGEHARKYLQDIVTQDVDVLRGGNDRAFSAMLNPKGRALFDVHISAPAAGLDSSGVEGHETFFVDVASEQAALFSKHARMYNLRTRVQLSTRDADLRVWAFVPTPANVAPHADAESALDAFLVTLRETVGSEADASIGVDPRTSALGIRAILPDSVDVPALSGVGTVAAADDETATTASGPRVHTILRTCLGVPEGESVRGSIPLEWNLDSLSGVSFSKGCYLGQELTARTNFQGLVRKRWMPVVLQREGEVAAGPAAPSLGAMLSPTSATAASLLGALDVVGAPWLNCEWDGPRIEPGSDIRVGDSGGGNDGVRGKRAGRIVSVAPGTNVGLAIVRLEHVSADGSGSDLVVEGDDGQRTSVVPVVPAWWNAAARQSAGFASDEE